MRHLINEGGSVAEKLSLSPASRWKSGKMHAHSQVTAFSALRLSSTERKADIEAVRTVELAFSPHLCVLSGT